MREVHSGGMAQRFYVANSLSTLGDGTRLSALPLLTVVIARGSAVDVALVAGISRAAWLSAPFVGTLVDRWSRQICMVSADIVRAALLLTLGVLALGRPALPAVLLIALVTGVCEIFFDCAAQSVVPAIAGESSVSLERMNSRLMAIQTVGTGFVGPPLGAVLWESWHPLPFFADGGTFVVSAALLSGLRDSCRTMRNRHSDGFLQDTWAGVRYLLGRRELRRLTGAVALLGIAQQAAFGTLVLFATRRLHLSADGYGLLLTVAAIGALGGAQVSPFLIKVLGSRGSLWGSVGLTILTYALIALVPAWWVVAVLGALNSACVVTWNVITVSLRQRIIPPDLMGRVTSGYRLAAWGAMPMGAFLGGKVASMYGLAAPWAAAAAIMVLVAPLMWGIRISIADDKKESPDAHDHGPGEPANDPGASAGR